MQKKLTKRELSSFLKKHPDWKSNPKETELSRVVTFTKYIDGLVLIARIAVHAEILQHHPDITFSYSKLKIKLSTHDAKGITKLDIKLATRIDGLLSK